MCHMTLTPPPWPKYNFYIYRFKFILLWSVHPGMGTGTRTLAKHHELIDTLAGEKRGRCLLPCFPQCLSNCSCWVSETHLPGSFWTWEQRLLVYIWPLGICKSPDILDPCAFGIEGTQLPSDSQEAHSQKLFKNPTFDLLVSLCIQFCDALGSKDPTWIVLQKGCQMGLSLYPKHGGPCDCKRKHYCYTWTRHTPRIHCRAQGTIFNILQ